MATQTVDGVHVAPAPQTHDCLSRSLWQQENNNESPRTAATQSEGLLSEAGVWALRSNPETERGRSGGTMPRSRLMADRLPGIRGPLSGTARDPCRTRLR